MHFCLILASLALALQGCATLPDPKHTWQSFPKEAYIGVPKRPFERLGIVRSKVDYQTLDPDHDENQLCRNYFNKAARELLDFAKKKGADAVVDVRSVVFTMDGKSETYPRAECADDGSDGQVLAQGVAIKWKQALPPDSSPGFDKNPDFGNP